MRRAALLIASAFVLGGCRAHASQFDVSSTRSCLESRGHIAFEAHRGDRDLRSLAGVVEGATGILWSPRLGAIVFEPGPDEARRAQQRLVELGRRNAHAMTPNDAADPQLSATVYDNALVLSHRSLERNALAGCLR